MVRFKVIRASRLLLGIAIALLAAVLCALAVRLFAPGGEAPLNASANLVEAQTSDEAETASVFASNLEGKAGGLPMDPDAAAIEVEVLPRPTEAARKSVLIYHTHTHEAYEQVSDDPYKALEAWRTDDADHSVVRVGDELQRLLEQYGFEVVHDVTDHEGSELSTAYTRSLETLQRYDRRFDLYIDLHRDAWVEGMESATVNAEGESTAQLMLLIGNGEGFDEKPYYKQNLAFAEALEARINAIEPGLCKPALVKDGRYNQHIGVFAVLVEVGHNRNTLREALNAVPALAKGIDSLLVEKPDPLLSQMRENYIVTARSDSSSD